MTDAEAPDDDSPQRRHLRRLDHVWVHQPIYLITVCTCERRELLLGSAMAGATTDCLADTRARHAWQVGRYVIMADHLHFLCTPEADASDLSAFVGGFKQASTRAAWRLGHSGRLWQREFHDHLLRSASAYTEKDEYVRMNPVRRGLCADADEWPHGGVLDVI